MAFIKRTRVVCCDEDIANPQIMALIRHVRCSTLRDIARLQFCFTVVSIYCVKQTVYSIISYKAGNAVYCSTFKAKNVRFRN